MGIVFFCLKLTFHSHNTLLRKAIQILYFFRQVCAQYKLIAPIKYLFYCALESSVLEYVSGLWVDPHPLIPKTIQVVMFSTVYNVCSYHLLGVPIYCIKQITCRKITLIFILVLVSLKLFSSLANSEEFKQIQDFCVNFSCSSNRLHVSFIALILKWLNLLFLYYFFSDMSHRVQTILLIAALQGIKLMWIAKAKPYFSYS